MRRTRARRAAREAAAAAPVREPAPTACWLCARPLGDRLEWHHPVPKSRGGRMTAAVHPICHRTLHATFTNHELERIGDDPAALAADERIARFLKWIADKPPGFHAPTRTAR